VLQAAPAGNDHIQKRTIKDSDMEDKNNYWELPTGEHGSEKNIKNTKQNRDFHGGVKSVATTLRRSSSVVPVLGCSSGNLKHSDNNIMRLAHTRPAHTQSCV
jgi:hypothetical protein